MTEAPRLTRTAKCATCAGRRQPMTDVRDATAIRDDLRTLGRLPVTLTDQGAPLRLAGDVAPLLDRCGFLERVLERAERERDDAIAELASLRAQRDAALALHHRTEVEGRATAC